MSNNRNSNKGNILFWIVLLPIMLFAWGWKRSKKATLTITSIILVIILMISNIGTQDFNLFDLDIFKGSEDNSNKLEGGEELTVHFISVGQADSIFIDYGDYDILIDGGNNSDGPLVVEYLKELETDDIEIMIATHPHEDHIGGLDDVLEAYSVETIIDSGLDYDSKTYKDYYSAAQNEEGATFIQDKNMTFELGENVILKILETGDDFKDTNDFSVIVILDYNDIEFLFTGDMESHVELESLNLFSDIDVLKVGHHGSSTSSSNEFLNVTKPEYAVICVGEGNKYGHPHAETLEKLNARNIDIYRTDELGHIIVTTDGNNVTFNNKAAK